MADGDRYFDNIKIIDDVFDGKTYGSNHIALGADAGGASVDIEVEDGEYYTLFDVATKTYKTFNHLGVEQ